MANVISASGYKDLLNTPLADGIVFAGMIIDKNFEDDWLHKVTNSRVLDPLLECGQVIQFQKPPQVGSWRPYEKNQERVYDQPKGGNFCISICNQAYKSIKIDKQDIRAMCDNWNAYEGAFLDNAWQNLSALWHTEVITGMQLTVSSKNMGAKAGRYKNINLGTIGNALHLTPQNIIGFFDRLQTTLKQARRWYNGEMFLLVPPAMISLLLQTMHEKQMCCDVSGSLMFKGLRAVDIMGFTVIESDRLEPTIDPATGRLVYTILAGWNEAYAFAGDVIDADIDKIPHSWGVSYNLLSLYGGGVIYPDGLAKAYVTFSTEDTI